MTKTSKKEKTSKEVQTAKDAMADLVSQAARMCVAAHVDSGLMLRVGLVLGEVAAVRLEHESGRRTFPPWTCAKPNIANPFRLTVLAEDFGRVAVQVGDEIVAADGKALPDPRPRTLRAELVQLAAVAVAWVEGLDADDTTDPTREPGT